MGLARVQQVAQRLGLATKPAPLTIVVGGTNGKGSSVALIAASLRGVGLRVATYTSPHILHFSERIAINGVSASDAQLLDAFVEVEKARANIELTFFEYTTLAGLWLIQGSECDAAVLEVGLGGRLDAVNIVDADAALITTVDLDHQDFLGDTREVIGYEKAGILRRGQLCVYSDLEPVASVLNHASLIGATLMTYGRDFDVAPEDLGFVLSAQALGEAVFLPNPVLSGAGQRRNAAAVALLLLSLQSSKAYFAGLSLQSAIGEAIETTTVQGRFQTLSTNPTIIVDVAHNPQAARALAETLAQRPELSRVAVFGAMADKDIVGIMQSLRPYFDRWLLVPLDTVSPRGASPALLVGSARLAGVEQLLCASVADALADHTITGSVVICFGSFLIVEAAIRAIAP